jgi:hypothetical protein
MDGEKTRAEQEQQAVSDATYGSFPDPNGGDYYLAAYNACKEQQGINDAANGLLPDPNGGNSYLNAYNTYKANNQPPPSETN